MAYRGERIENEITGEHITFLRTSEETNGERLVFDCRVDPGKRPLRPHVHRNQEERFTVISGELGVMLGGEKEVFHAGDRVILPARVKHQWWNAGDGEVHFRVEVDPAGNLEQTLESIAGMVAAGRMTKNCMPRNPFELANLGRFSDTYLPAIPIWAQRTMLAMASAFGRVLGYEPTLAKYRAAETSEAAELADAA